MQPTFKPPKNEAEFKERVKDVTPAAAQNMINILRRRRADAVKHIDAEILFWKKALDYKQKESA